MDNKKRIDTLTKVVLLQEKMDKRYNSKSEQLILKVLDKEIATAFDQLKILEEDILDESVKKIVSNININLKSKRSNTIDNWSESSKNDSFDFHGIQSTAEKP